MSPQDKSGALMNFSTYYSTTPGTGVLIFNVYAERRPIRLDRQALLKLVDVTKQAAMWHTTEDTSSAVFTDIPYGSYEVEASAVGYLSAHKELKVVQNLGPVQIDIVLERDPSALNLDVANSILSSKARRQAKHAVSALKSSNLEAAQKRLGEAYKSSPSSPE